MNSSIADIAGNPLIEAVDNTQTVDTVNPSTLGDQPGQRLDANSTPNASFSEAVQSVLSDLTVRCRGLHGSWPGSTPRG